MKKNTKPAALSPIDPTTTLERVSVSKLSMFTRCHRMYYWKYIRNLIVKNFYVPYFVGGLVHQGLAMFYEGKPIKLIMFKIRKEMEKEINKSFIPPELVGNVEIQKAIVFGMLKGYIRTHGSEPKIWKQQYVEQPFSLQIGDLPVKLFGVIDMVSLKKDSLWVDEHKTASQITKNYIDRLPMDLQAQVYPAFIERCLGKKLSGVCYNIIRKVTIRQKKNETFPQFIDRIADEYYEKPDHYYYREYLKYNPRNINDAWNDILAITEELWNYYQVLTESEVLDSSNWYRDTNQCFSYNMQCPYYKLCRYGYRPEFRTFYKKREEIGNEEAIEELGNKKKSAKQKKRTN